MMKWTLAIALMLGCGCDGPESGRSDARAFAGCLAQWDGVQDGISRWHYQCENAEGLWKCSRPMDRSSCVWEGPLPEGHPLHRPADGCLADVKTGR